MIRNRISEDRSHDSQQREEKLIEIDGPYLVWSVAFLADGEHVVSGGHDGKI